MPTLIFSKGVLKVRLPFHGKKVFFFIVALFANRDYVSLGGLAATYNRNDMVHGQFRRREMAPAIMALAPGQTLVPPAGFAQGPGLFPLSFYFFFTYLNNEWFWHFLNFNPLLSPEQ
jgi:hypothetical protein